MKQQRLPAGRVRRVLLWAYASALLLTGCGGGLDSPSAVLPVSEGARSRAVLGYVGDPNKDGKSTAADASVVQQVAAGLDSVPSGEQPLYDANKDAEVTAADASVIQQWAAGLESWPREPVEGGGGGGDTGDVSVTVH